MWAELELVRWMIRDGGTGDTALVLGRGRRRPNSKLAPAMDNLSQRAYSTVKNSVVMNESKHHPTISGKSKKSLCKGQPCGLPLLLTPSALLSPSLPTRTFWFTVKWSFAEMNQRITGWRRGELLYYFYVRDIRSLHFINKFCQVIQLVPPQFPLFTVLCMLSSPPGLWGSKLLNINVSETHNLWCLKS